MNNLSNRTNLICSDYSLALMTLLLWFLQALSTTFFLFSYFVLFQGSTHFLFRWFCNFTNIYWVIFLIFLIFSFQSFEVCSNCFIRKIYILCLSIFVSSSSSFFVLLFRWTLNFVWNKSRFWNIVGEGKYTYRYDIRWGIWI